jgi:hypothetical protein
VWLNSYLRFDILTRLNICILHRYNFDICCHFQESKPDVNVRLPVHQSIWEERSMYSTRSMRWLPTTLNMQRHSKMHFMLKDWKGKVYVQEPSTGNLIKITRRERIALMASYKKIFAITDNLLTAKIFRQSQQRRPEKNPAPTENRTLVART